ncbi:hypothetical protein ACIBSV_36915 [Embleya sp. NPDC050154]|uniref:hypothetical protein n=1 Tax=Embleya sp. NPDC050154 TaxID=3363988 RepID=UPI0037BC5C8C
MPNPETVARDQALEVYGRYVDLQVALEAGADLDPATARTVSTGRAMTILETVVSVGRERGTVIRGPQGERAPHVVSVSLTSTPPSVVIEDCVDVSRLVVTRRDTGEVYPVPTQSPRYIKSYTVQQQQPSGWLVSDVRAQRDRTC